MLGLLVSTVNWMTRACTFSQSHTLTCKYGTYCIHRQLNYCAWTKRDKKNIVTYVWHRLVRQRHTWLHCDWTGSERSRIWTCRRMQGQSWLLWLAVLAFLCTGRDDIVYKLELWQLDRHWSHQPRNLSNAFQLQPHSQSVEANSHRLFSRDVVLTSFLGLGPKGIWASHHLVSSRCFVHNFDSRLQLQSCVPRSVIRGLNLFRPKMEKQPTCLRGWTYRHHFCTCRYL